MCVFVFVVLVVVVVVGMVVCGGYITMETVAFSCREDIDAGVSAALAAERSNMAATKSTGPPGRRPAACRTGRSEIFPLFFFALHRLSLLTSPSSQLHFRIGSAPPIH